jgi:outer membrane protein
MKTFSLYALSTAAMLAFAPVALADTAPAAAASEIATVNIQQIFSDSTAAKSVHDQLEGKSKTFQAEIAKKQDQLQKEDQELGKQQSVLSKAAFDEKAGAFRKKVADAQKEMQAKKALLDNASGRAGAEIQKAVNGIVSDLAREKGFVAALPTSEMLYADAKLDITTEVLKRLNDKLPQVDVKFDTAAMSEAIEPAKTKKK